MLRLNCGFWFDVRSFVLVRRYSVVNNNWMKDYRQ